MKNCRRHEETTLAAEPYAKVLRMYSDFREQTRDIYGRPGGLPLNVAIAYEDFPAGVRALGIFRGLFGGTEARYEFDVNNTWKFDFLRADRLREAAIAETARADMMIVSVDRPVELPPEVKCWLESSLEQREGDPGALVFLYHAGEENGGGRSAAESYLAQRARRAGLDFFVKRPNAKPRTLAGKRNDFWRFANSQHGRGSSLAGSLAVEHLRRAA